MKIPPILLEGDPAPTPLAAPLAAAPPLAPPPAPVAVMVSAAVPRLPEATPAPSVPPAAPVAELPEAYGTGDLRLTARDPYSVHAHWDATEAQRRRLEVLAAEGGLRLRLRRHGPDDGLEKELRLSEQPHGMFVNVAEAGRSYEAELGYYEADGNRWVSVARSRAAITPPDQPSAETLRARFERVPAEPPFEELVRRVMAAVGRNVPLLEAVEELRRQGLKGLPDAATLGSGRWTPWHEQALREWLAKGASGLGAAGPLGTGPEAGPGKALSTGPTPAAPPGAGQEPTALVSRVRPSSLALQGGSPGGAAGPGGPSSEAGPGGVAQGAQREGFWFNVNAELVVYGATEPGAQVVVGGRLVPLRADGTFSCRFALLEGRHRLEAEATSADQNERRCAVLTFSRATDYRGQAGSQAGPAGPTAD